MRVFKGKTIFLDTAPLIYLIEGVSPWFETIRPFFEASSRGEFITITSALTLQEVLVGPYKKQQTELAIRYKNVLTKAQNLTILPIDEQVAEQAAIIRAKYNIKTPDSLQLATAIVHQSDYFLTNDEQLKRVTKTRVITLTDLTSMITNK
ncbi:MAG: type II toxin-antitoxin system VapC family toxin [Saprospiraceae bacterium]